MFIVIISTLTEINKYRMGRLVYTKYIIYIYYGFGKKLNEIVHNITILIQAMIPTAQYP